MNKSSYIFLTFLIGTLLILNANSQNVFAHYMMGNSYPSDVGNFANNIRIASSIGIDGFALNIGPDDWMADRISKMFNAATQFPNFRLFISFDMAVMPGNPIVLTNYMQQYCSHPNYFKYQGRCFASTFAGESQTFGEANVNDGWQKHFKDPLNAAGISVFLVPSWTALGPVNMFENHPVLDGAFSWAAWASDNQYKTTDEDNIYIDGARRNGKIYMAPVSPWFFTHFSYKNWIDKSEALYPRRWEQIVTMRPELVEIITWNDYGESHYIGPIDGALPDGSEKWVNGFDHQGWLAMTAYYIQAYKSGSYPSVQKDQVTFWYRTHSKDARRDDVVAPPDNHDWAEDTIVVHALLTSDAQITVQNAGQTTTLNGSAGKNTWQVNFGEGNVVVALVRNGQTLASKQGDKPITNGGSLYNFNACVNHFESGNGSNPSFRAIQA